MTEIVHIYIYTHDLEGRAFYERTVDSIETAKKRVQELNAQGKQATYHTNVIKGAFY
jgi:hypothetical protein